jgi:glyoxylase-like metal-dependent hydrolase (beta-lactamase superfamily II)
VATARHCLPPLRKQIELVSKESEVVPGIHLLRAPGHTPGHMAVAISSENDAALDIGDAVIHLLLLEQTGWRPAVDLVPGQAADTRRRLLDRAAADRTKVMAFHFPFPAMGRITPGKSGGWHWEAAERGDEAGQEPGRSEEITRQCRDKILTLEWKANTILNSPIGYRFTYNHPHCARFLAWFV